MACLNVESYRMSQRSCCLTALFHSPPLVADYSSDWWRVLPGTSIDRNDIDCGRNTSFIHETSGQVVNFCYVCGGTEAVADACALHSECVGFVMDNGKDDGKCGYLKSAVLEQARKEVPSETLYCMGSEADCAGGCVGRSQPAQICCVVVSCPLPPATASS